MWVSPEGAKRNHETERKRKTMIMTDAAAASEIRSSLKKLLGYTNRQVSVVARDCAIWVKAKVAGLDLQKIYDIAMKYQIVDRDEKTGEILCGGNRFIFVDDENGKCVRKKLLRS